MSDGKVSGIRADHTPIRLLGFTAEQEDKIVEVFNGDYGAAYEVASRIMMLRSRWRLWNKRYRTVPHAMWPYWAHSVLIAALMFVLAVARWL